MALIDDDAGLEQDLRALLRQHGADWIAEEVDAARAAEDADPDMTIAEALIVAVARVLGPVPTMLVQADAWLAGSSSGTQTVHLADEEPFGGVILGDISVARSSMSDLAALTDSAAVLLRAADEIEGRRAED
jgi:hypothetical protein